MKTSHILMTVIIISGCATTAEIRPEIHCPPLPTLPIVYAEELDPLDDVVYGKVIDRDQGWQDYAEELLTICKAQNSPI